MPQQPSWQSPRQPPAPSRRRDHQGHSPANAVRYRRRASRCRPDAGATDRSAAAGPRGITVAALAEAMQVRAANELPDHLGEVIITYAQMLSGLGQITAGAAPQQAGNPAEILFPPALLCAALLRAPRHRWGWCPAHKPESCQLLVRLQGAGVLPHRAVRAVD